MHNRSSPAHAKEEPPTLRSEDIIASERWRARVGSGPAVEPALERVPERSLRDRIARAVKAPVLAGIAVFVVAVIVTIGIVAASSLGGDVAPDAGAEAMAGVADADGLGESADAGTGSGGLTGGGGENGATGSGAGTGAGTGAEARPLAGDQSAAGNSSDAASGPGAATAAGALIFVHVVGEVARPGVIELLAGARAQDAIEAAGGATGAAVLSGLNLARPLVDGEQLVVPDKAAVAAALEAAAETGQPHPPGDAAPADAPPSEAPASATINLNSADATQLETLPRVGPALAERIIDWRTQNGGFTSVDQLLEVSGIGAKTLAGFRDRVTV
ncbi:competence protein ComEA [Leucobacter exalbidus]|uniref:Competence protein ComEA n=1 Tax=Leucobacter exalbidus TaxID=662960 RepID=A0A940PVN6_9MICO|nr:ComEA family DNA-binding protein [Leucobacter exalbidus]MBP1325046.1 competence protein ComEA [Leucobacter exalbidus]